MATYKLDLNKLLSKVSRNLISTRCCPHSFALQIEVKLSEDKDLSNEEKQQIHKELKLFLQPLREKLLQFEQELRNR